MREHTAPAAIVVRARCRRRHTEGVELSEDGAASPAGEEGEIEEPSAESEESSAEEEEGGAQLEDGRWLVDRLVATRISDGVKAGDVHRKGTHLYKVLWQGFGVEEATWEPKSKLPAELVASFESEREPSPSKRARQPSEAASPSAKSPPSKR